MRKRQRAVNAYDAAVFSTAGFTAVGGREDLSGRNHVMVLLKLRPIPQPVGGQFDPHQLQPAVGLHRQQVTTLSAKPPVEFHLCGAF